MSLDMYRIMQVPGVYKVERPFYIERWHEGRWYERGKWVAVDDRRFYSTVEDARFAIEQAEAYTREQAEKRRSVPSEVGFGYVANDGKFYWLRDGD